MSARYTKEFLARPEHIDELGHVNNTVWVRWIQDIAVEHWDSAARPEDSAQYFWVVTRHEIDYRGNVSEGESVTGETWIEGEPRAATSIRKVEFRNAVGKPIVWASTTWAMLDRETQRLVRVRPDILQPFRG